MNDFSNRRRFLKPRDDQDAATQLNAPETIAKRPGAIKARLLKAIGAAGADETGAALDRIWSTGAFDVRQAPRAGMVMVTVRDCFDTPFHLGEVLVSEAEVALDGHHGYGLICGDAPEQALLLAAVEAAESAGLSPALESIDGFIGQLEARNARHRTKLAKLTAATEVQFAAMKKETVDFGSLGEP
jgi:phosphonate C-P lyase system protein PhnG